MVVWIHNVQQLTRAYVDRVLVPYAQEIAEADVEEMPQYSWGSAVLAATFTLRLTARTESGDHSVKGNCMLCRQHWIGSNAMTTGNNSYTTSLTMHCIVN